MAKVKRLSHWLLASLIVFVIGNGIGYVGRTWECRGDLQTVYLAAPGYEARHGVLPPKLYEVSVTKCTLPEQWGGDRPAISRYP